LFRISHILPGAMVLAGLALLGMVAVVTSADRVHATPRPDHVFHGSVTVAGSAAANDLVVEARLGGVNYADSVRGSGTATTSGGEFGRGSAVDFKVNADDSDTTGTKEGATDGEAITFFVNGQQATITVVETGTACAGISVPDVGAIVSTFPFCSGSASRLNLAAAAAPTPTPTPVPSSVVLPPAPTATPTPSAVSVSTLPVGVLTLSGLSVSPATANPSETVTISFVAKNTGNALLSTTVSVLVEGVSVVTFVITDLNVGTSQPFTVTTSKVEPGTYLVQVGDLSASFTVAGPSPTPTPTGLPTVSEKQTLTVTTTVEVTVGQRQVLDAALEAGLGVALDITSTNMVVSTTDEGLVLTLAIEGLQAGQEVRGRLYVTLGNLTIETVDGQGTAVLDLGGGLTVTAEVGLEIVDGQLKIVLLKPQLRLVPPPPDATALSGGNATVTEIGVVLSVALTNLPDGASLEVAFAKDPAVFVDDPVTMFQLAAASVGGVIGDLDEDLAFLINITKSGITNDDLGDTTMTMEVSAAWRDARIAQGKVIVIAKIDDAGNVFSEEATCTVVNSSVSCSVKFTGAAGGLSVFALMSVVVPTPTPTPTPTVVPPPTGGPTYFGALAWIAVVLGVLLAGFGALLLQVGRKRLV